jgi:hypothetical protein
MTTHTFAAVLGVKDEVELIGACVDRLRRIGVERIRVLDAGSTDGTLDVLASLAGPDLSVTHHSDLDPDGLAWARTAARLGRESGADWVVFLDADEFWLPAGGTLHGVHGLADHDVLEVERFNVPLDAQGLRTADRALPAPDRDLEVIVRSLPDFRRRLETDPTLPWIRIVPAGKVMARAERIAHVSDGFHRIMPTDGPPLRIGRARDVLIAHVPYTTLTRFATKVGNIRKVFAVHDEYCGDTIAWHWRRLLACTDDAKVRAEFDLQVFDDATLAALRDEGVVVSASAWLAASAR